MAFHLDFGKKGEDLAAVYLEGQLYRILHRNWTMGKKEIDIIALHDGLLVFVEVKTRHSSDLYWPETAVNKKKQRFLETAAQVFMEQYSHDFRDVRFDVIAITFSGETEYELVHFDDAF